MLKITSQLIFNEAKARGWKVEALDDRFSSVLAITPPGAQRQFMFSCMTNSSSAVGYTIADDKLITYMVAKELDIPVAEYCMYADGTEAHAAMEFFNQQVKAGYEIVVKPTDQTHADGITIGVKTVEHLHRALEHARTFSDKILLQRRYFGTDCRVVVVDGVVRAAAYRTPPFVIGDGEHTVKALITIKNQDPRRGEGHYAPLSKIDTANVVRYIGADRLDEVPKKGERVELLGTANLSKGGEAIDITDTLHDSYKQAAVALTKELKLGISGIDFLTKDFTKPLSPDTAILLEVNYSPGLRMHHFPSEGTPRNVAGAVLDALERSLTKQV